MSDAALSYIMSVFLGDPYFFATLLSSSVIIRLTRARLAAIPMQDYLGLGAEARMNTPGILGNGNWQWRMADGALTVSVTSMSALA